MKLPGFHKGSWLARGVLYLLPVMASACIIPKSLKDEAADPNFRPVFVPSEMMPALGSLPPGVANSQLDLKFVVDDQNLFDTLRVRLFMPRTENGVTRRTALPVEITLDDEAGQPGRRFGRPPIQTNYCNLVQDQTQPTDLIAVVADRPFGGMTDMGTTAPPDQAAGGLTDERIWTLRCTQ